MTREFEEKVEKIFSYIAEFGIKRMPIHLLGRVPNESERIRFKALVHFGFRLGQKLLVTEMLALLNYNSEIREEIKDAARQRDKARKERLTEILNEGEFKVQILRHFADFIAWQMIGSHPYRARTFYSGNKYRPDLTSTNLEAVIGAVEYMLLEDPRSFGLITDLTTFIDIGDILWVRDEALFVVEVKSGAKQRVVNQLIKKMYDQSYQLGPKDLDGFTPSMLTQAKRTMEQHRKGSVLINYLRDEKGKDPFTGENRYLYEVATPQEHYFEDILKVLQLASKEGFAETTIEGIIGVAVFKAEYTPKALMFDPPSHAVQDQLLIEDYLSQIYIPIREPLFYKPISRELIFDILFRKLRVILTLDLDKLIAFFNEGGLKTQWLSTKESFKYKEEKQPKSRPFFLHNRVIQLKTENLDIVLGDTFVIKLLFDNVKPSAVRQTYVDLSAGVVREEGKNP